MRIVHLTASSFFGGPERQILGLTQALAPRCSTRILSFSEGGRCAEFLQQLRQANLEAVALQHDHPRLLSAVAEIARHLREFRAEVLCCHGYKSNLLGRWAARRVGCVAIAVSRGWTGENGKVRLYETLDRWHLRWMDQVVCVSEGQAQKVRRCGVPPERIRVIRNSARIEAFAQADASYREQLRQLLPDATPRTRVVVAAGRLSPEKGFHFLIAAAREVLAQQADTCFVLFGEGAQRPQLEQQIQTHGLSDRFLLAGFRPDLDRLLPWADLVVLPSLTEGLPNVALEASAAGVPVVATAVGGTPEVIRDGQNGLLVPPGQPHALAQRIIELLQDPARAEQLGQTGKALMRAEFTFAAQAQAYLDLFRDLLGQRRGDSLTRTLLAASATASGTSTGTAPGGGGGPATASGTAPVRGTGTTPASASRLEVAA